MHKNLALRSLQSRLVSVCLCTMIISTTAGSFTRGCAARDLQIQAFASNNRIIAGYPEDNRGIAQYFETIGLDSKDPYPCNCGIASQPKSRAIAHYTENIMRNPKDDDAYFRRGIANLYAGSLANALADIGRAGELDPEYPYYALWLDIVDKRSGLASRLPKAVSQIDMTKWPAPVIRLFLGQTTPAAVLAAADDPDAETRKGQVCEANFYSGELALQHGSKDEAERLFRLAATDCPGDEFVERAAANAEVKALGRIP
jgi:hypothetical protein